ncbi:MAG: hypothetical protein KDC44_20150 [Phaeodactylibacter sp.]|nr:hypothetical protein [Phaeodactylibacter sp.]
MYKFLTRNGRLLAFGLGVLITLVFLVSVIPNLEEFNMATKEAQKETGIFNSGLIAVIFLTIVGAVAAIFFGLFQTLTNLKGSIKGLIGVGLLIVVFLIAYALSTPETGGPIFETIQEFNISDGQSKFISGALLTTLIMVIGAAAAFVFSEIRNFFK